MTNVPRKSTLTVIYLWHKTDELQKTHEGAWFLKIITFDNAQTRGEMTFLEADIRIPNIFAM